MNQWFGISEMGHFPKEENRKNKEMEKLGEMGKAAGEWKAAAHGGTTQPAMQKNLRV